jgi:hypothetical protein
MQQATRPHRTRAREASDADVSSVATDGFDAVAAEELLRALHLGGSGDTGFRLHDEYEGRPSHVRGISYSQPARSRSQSRNRNRGQSRQRGSGSTSGSSSATYDLFNLDPNGEAMYSCTAVQMCMPSTTAKYAGLPFLVLAVGDIVDVLLEGGHPARVQNELPIVLPCSEDEEDTMLVVRDERGRLGWALASFLLPLT